MAAARVLEMRAACVLLLCLALTVSSVSAQQFVDRWSQAGFSSAEANQGVALGDQDGDGLGDVFLTSTFVENPIPFLPDLGGPDQLYRSLGNGNFNNQAAALGLDDEGQGLGAAWADWNNDGLLDLYVVRGFQQIISQDHLLYRQTANGFDSSPSVFVSAAGAGRNVCWADYDNDGHVDVFVTNGLDSADLLPDARVFLFRNNGDGSFSDVTINLGLEDRRNGHGCCWADYDNDGDQDLYVANHGFEDPILGFADPQPNALYQNQLVETGSPGFVDVATAAGVDGLDEVIPGEPGGSASFACAWGDWDNDGWLDLFVTNGFTGLVPFPTPNRLWRNTGDGRFDERSLQMIDPDFDENSFGATWGDFDNDGDLDLYVTNAELPLISDADNDLFINSGPPLWILANDESRGVSVSEWAQACASADLNGDGYLDIYSLNGVPGFELFLEVPDNYFVNQGGSNHWIHFDLVGTLSNRSAIGARVTLTAGGRQQIREVNGGSGYQSMDDLRVEFGLGADTLAPSAVIRWPSGCTQSLDELAIDSVHRVVEECAASILRNQVQAEVGQAFPLPIYVQAPPQPPWEDPEPVLADQRFLLYQHSEAGVVVKAVKTTGSLRLVW